MKVAAIMTGDVRVCAPSETLNRAAQLMWENDCGSIPVAEADATVVGMLTDRDICMAAYTQGANLHNLQAVNAMATNVLVCRPDDDLSTAQEIMRKHRVRRLPVVNEDRHLVGIISLSDIGRAAIEPAAKSEVADTLAAVSAPRERTPASKATKESRASRPTRRRTKSPKQ